MMENKYPMSCVIAMDETALWMDMPAETTLDIRGTRSVPIKTTGHEKSRFTVCLAACADGRKMWPFILFKGKRPVKALAGVTGAYIAYSDNGWMNESTTISWIRSCCGGTFATRRLLCWDTFRAHATDRVRREAALKKMDMAFVPGGCTGILQVCARYCFGSLLTLFLQAPDVCWNKPFKQKYQELYDTWQREGAKTYTKGGNPRAPTKSEIVQWVKLAWRSLSTELIVNSFRTCGITVATDGSEDTDVHCLKPGQAAEGALEILRSETQKLFDQDQMGDPFDSGTESNYSSDASSSADQLSFCSSQEGDLYQRDVDL